MTDSLPTLPSTLEECHARLREYEATIVMQQETIDKQQELLESLSRDLALLKRAMFGRRRERFEDPRQELLFNSATLDPKLEPEPAEDDLTPPEEGAVNTPRRRKGRRRRVFPECLPRRRVERPLRDEEIPAHLRDQDGRRFFKKAGEWVEYENPALYVVEEFVEVLAVDNEDATETALITAEKPPRILDCFAGPSLLANLTVQRFADHLPYYREEEILERSGISIPRSTLCRWMIRLSVSLLPLVMRMRELALASDVVQADETPVKLLVPDLDHAQTSYLWAVLGDKQHPYTTFYFTADRSRAGPDQFLAGIEGYLVSDAYVAYTSIGNESNGTIRLVGCHTHARRKFEELHDLGPTEQTSTALGFFHRLYDIEDQAREMTDEQRHQLRQEKSAPIVHDFKTWLDRQLATLRPKHDLRGAINYMTSRWENFTRFLESGAIPFDNNASEQAVKVAVIGKKNWLFFGSEEGGRAAAILYSLTATCRDLKIDPLAYLKDVYERLPLMDATEVDLLLPDRWIDEHPQHRLAQRVRAAEQKANRKRTRRSQRRKALQRAAAK